MEICGILLRVSDWLPTVELKINKVICNTELQEWNAKKTD